MEFKPEFDLILSEDGDDRSTDPVGELYADHAVLFDGDVRIAEWRKMGDEWPVFIVTGSDLMLSDDDEAALNGYCELSDAIEFAKTWYLARV